MRIKTKLALLFTFLSLLTVASLGYIAYHVAERAIRQDISDHLLDMNLLKEAEIARWIASNERSLRELAQRPLVREYAAALISHELSDLELLDSHTKLISDHLLPMLETQGGFLDLSVLHPVDGLILASTDPTLEGKYRENKPFFIQGRADTYTGNMTYELGVAKVVMHVSTPIVDTFGSLIGVLVAHVDLAELSKITMQHSGFATEEDTYLVNKFNFFVTEPAFGEDYALHKAVYTEGVAFALEGGTGVSLYDDYRGIPVLGAYRWIEERELAILTEVPVSQAFALIVGLRNTIAGIAAATVLAAIFLSFMFARRITRRIQVLSDSTKSLAAGNLSIRIQQQPKRDEIGLLEHSFNKMAEDLQATTISRDELSTEIKERKKVEEALQASSEKYRLMFANAPVGYQSLNEDGCLLDVNETWLGTLGYKRNEVIGKWFGDFLHPDQQKLFRRLFSINIQSQEIVRDVEYRLLRKDGSYIDANYTASTSFDDAGNFLRTHCVFQDVTERKHAEDRALSLGAILEQSSNEIYIFDAETLKFLEVNGGAQSNIGYSMEELLELTPLDIKPEFTRQQFGETIAVLRTGEMARIDFQTHHKRKDGSLYPVEVHLQLLPYRGMPAFVAIILDITERIQIEEEKLVMEAYLRQSQKLESIGTLASGVAHEINNPLMGMMNYAELVKDKVQDPKAIEYLKGIDDEGNRIAKIVRNLLSFSRQDKEKHSPAQLADIIESSLSLVGSLLRKDQITLEIDIQDNLPQLLCRSQQIQQVVINLLTNAHDALNVRYPEYDENKLVRITARSFERDGENWIRTTVEDHGSGIPEDVARRIFDPFFTTKPRPEGTGLGLSISFGIVREHQGELTVESVPGEFTRFHMDLRVNNGWRQGKEEV